MSYPIAMQEQDLAGNFRVWVDLGHDELQMFKFDADPTPEQVQAEVLRFLEARAAAQSSGA